MFVEMHLFPDTFSLADTSFYVKQKRVGRELTSRERAKERWKLAAKGL
jgi:hypothetical protein